MSVQAKVQTEHRTLQGRDIPSPAKCVNCSFLDKEYNPLSGKTHFYCRAPRWHPKRWSCTLPAEVERA
jgi:hypothetical protein